jgi:glycosyltransferase involved in cell wall biosynthesis
MQRDSITCPLFPRGGNSVLHYFWLGLLGLTALFWFGQAVEIGMGVMSLRSLEDVTPLADSDCPRVSILFAARDEAEKLPDALKTFLMLDYPRYEVVAVDDRSEDTTPRILEDAARKNPALKFLRVNSLPAGWLGKPHALQQGYERSSGEWLVFTDADVHFAPDLLRRSIALAQREGWEHLTLLGHAKMFSFGEKIVMTFFGLAFLMAARPWKVSKADSRFYAGIGSFQLIRRSAYETMGTHRRLAMEVVDDMKLGKLVKDAGLRSGVGKAGKDVSVYWHSGVGNIVRGTTKNFFAASGFNLGSTCILIFGMLYMFVFPFAVLPFVRGWALVLDLVAVAIPLMAEAGAALEFEVSPLYALTFPIGALVFCWMLVRSTIVTLRQGGITWRGTFYPLEELKRGVV